MLVGQSMVADQKIDDSDAYRTGEKTAELILKQWIQLAKNNVMQVIELAQQVAVLSEKYSESFNRSFLQGNVDCLKKKNLKSIAEKEKLNKDGYARMLTCYYCWDAFINAALEANSFEIQACDALEENALKKAALEAYGSASPENLAKLKKSLADDALENADDN